MIIYSVSYIFKASEEKITTDGSLIVAIAGGKSRSLFLIDPKTLQHYERVIESSGSISSLGSFNDYSVNKSRDHVYVTCNDGKLYIVSLNDKQNYDDEEDDFMDAEGDDGDEIEVEEGEDNYDDDIPQNDF